jgi:hypothetical protein
MESIKFDSGTFDLVKELDACIKQAAKELNATAVIDRYSSVETKDIDLAMSKAQGEYPKLHYNRTAAYFQKEYSDLDLICSKILPVLSKFELTLDQYTELGDADKMILHTKIKHSSGQWSESRARIIPPKNDPICLTSTINQVKREQIMTKLGITISDDPYDDNAEIQLADDRQIYAQGTQSPMLYNPRERSTECISRDELNMLEKELVDCPDFVEEIFKGANIQSLADLPKNKYDYTQEKIRKIKLIRSGKRL